MSKTKLVRPTGGDLTVAATNGMDLAVLDSLPASKFEQSEKDFDKIAGSSFLPRLMLYGSNSDPVKVGTVDTGYSLVEGKDNFTYLGREVNILVISRRPKALSINGDTIISNHNIHSEEFQQIKNRADNEPDSGCMYGPEFLVWVPALSKFATFLMGSKTARNEAPKLFGLLRKPATLKTKLYENSKFKWHGPQVSKCSTPFDMPAPDDLIEKVHDFNNPKDSEVETVESDASKSARAR